MEMLPRSVCRRSLLTVVLFVAASIAPSQGFVSPGMVRFNYRYGTCPNMPTGICSAPSTSYVGTSGRTLGAFSARQGGLRGAGSDADGFSSLFAAGEAGSDEKPLLERVKDVVAEQLGVDRARVTPESNFIKDLDADSLDSVELVMAFEEKFGVSIPDDEAAKIATVQDALTYIEKAKAATA